MLEKRALRNNIFDDLTTTPSFTCVTLGLLPDTGTTPGLLGTTIAYLAGSPYFFYVCTLSVSVPGVYIKEGSCRIFFSAGNSGAFLPLYEVARILYLEKQAFSGVSV